MSRCHGSSMVVATANPRTRRRFIVSTSGWRDGDTTAKDAEGAMSGIVESKRDFWE